jgi:hypothetical protein
MTRKTRSDSAQATIKAMVAVALPEFDPPAHVRLPDEARPFWSGIMASRAREEWSKNDFVVAAQLARCQHDIERETMMLEGEGSVVENARGTQVMNPRHSVMEQLARRELALMRALGMNAASGMKDRSSQQAARKTQRQAEQVREELTDDDLLAT